MESMIIAGKQFQGYKIPTSSSNLLLIQGSQGFLGCGYFSIETANKINEKVAIVTGVKTYEDMLNAKVIKVSDAAKLAGIELGMSGEEALLLLA